MVVVVCLTDLVDQHNMPDLVGLLSTSNPLDSPGLIDSIGLPDLSGFIY